MQVRLRLRECLQLERNPPREQRPLASLGRGESARVKLVSAVLLFCLSSGEGGELSSTVWFYGN